MRQQRIESIDTIRGLACLLVLFSHIISTNTQYGMYVNGCGKIGVWCFMILSGFLSFLPYVKDTMGSRKMNWERLLGYYKNKIVRLYPVYLVSLLLAYIIGFLPTGMDLLKHVFCMEGQGHFWYMPVIAKFYLVFPLLVWLYQIMSSKARQDVQWQRNFAFLLMIATVIMAIEFPFTQYEENSIRLYWYFPVFAIGILLSMLYTKMHDRIKKQVGWDVCGVLILLVILLLTPPMRKLILGIEPSRWLQNKYLLFAILWSGFLWCSFWGRHIDNVLKKMKLLQKLGKISYQVYLIHYLILWKAGQYLTNTMMIAVVVIIISILFGWIMHEMSKALEFKI